jgi:hypothetical protein
MTSWGPEVQRVLDQEREAEREYHETLGDASVASASGGATDAEESDAYAALETSAEEIHELPRVWGIQNAQL